LAPDVISQQRPDPRDSGQVSRIIKTGCRLAIAASKSPGLLPQTPTRGTTPRPGQAEFPPDERSVRPSPRRLGLDRLTRCTRSNGVFH